VLAPVTAGLVLADGARGAAIATSLVELGVVVAGGVIACRHGRGRPRLDVIWKVAFAGAVGVTPAFWSSGPDAVRLVLAGALYAAAILLSRALPQEVDALLPSWWPCGRGRARRSAG
jgi:hypothetical protein